MGHFHIHSSDRIRGELLDNESDQSDNSLIFDTLHNRVKDDLANGISCCYDATNVNAKRRKAFLDEIKKYPCVKKCYIIACPFEICVQNDNIRERKVGEKVIEKFYKNFNLPTKREGWDEIHLVYNLSDRTYYDSNELLEGLCGIDQFNSHHTLTIGNHCKECLNQLRADTRFQALSNFDRELLSVVALYHDIGKKETATFINTKGETTDECHYYGHENVGAYKCLFLDEMVEFTKEEILTISDLIQLHMKLYSNTESEKYKEKLKRKLGDELYYKLELLHDADRRAK